MRTFFGPAIFIMKRLKFIHKIILFSLFLLLLMLNMLFNFTFHLGVSAVVYMFIALLVIYYFFSAFYFSTTQTIAILRSTAARIAKGDFSIRVDASALDEFSDIGESFNLITDAFQEILSKQLLIQEELHNQKVFSERLIQNSAVPTFVLDVNHNVLIWNKACEQLTGTKSVEVIGTDRHKFAFNKDGSPTLADLFLDGQTAEEFFYRTLRKTESTSNGLQAEKWFPNLSDEEKYLSIQVTPIFNNKGQLIAVIETLQNIADNKLTEDRLRLSMKVFENSLEGIVFTDPKGVIQWVNHAYCSITGYKMHEVIGKSVDQYRPWEKNIPFFKEVWDAIRETGYWQGEVWSKKKSGELYPEWMSMIEIRDDAGIVQNYAIVFLDISDLKKSNLKLKQLAYYDSLTKLPNRSQFYERFQAILDTCKQQKKKCALLFLDIDQFKLINDSLGHTVGDQLLRDVAQRLKKYVKPHDVFRIGGDEFAIVLQDANNFLKIENLARKIIEGFSEPFLLNSMEYFITTSIGISIYPNCGESIETLLKHADLAMYSAKENGKNTYKFYFYELNEKARKKLEFMSLLPRALENQEFMVFYQPQLHIQTNQIYGVEVLIRWNHPEKGLISPADFIPIAEENGWIERIGEWVLYTACRQMKHWQNAGFPQMRVSVNLSARQFMQKDLLHMVKRVLSETGLDPSYLELEITESISMFRVNTVIYILTHLDHLGVRVAIDDFGTGYSSLNYLKQFPINTLKIDQTFIRDIVKDNKDLAIVRSIISIAHGLNFEVIAEGVETHHQLSLLRSNGCDSVQGYLINRPLPATEIQKLLEAPPTI